MRDNKYWGVAVVAIALTISMLAAPVGAVHAAPLVSDGRAGGCIVVPKSSQQGRVLTAAKDLADYIKKMSDASIPIRRDSESCAGFRVLIGNTRLAPVEPAEVSAEKVGFDGFVIRTVPDGVVIAGRTPQGTANGVYHFAENVLDVHWFSLEDDGPTCPKRQTIEIPELNLTVKPDFQWRGQYYQGILKYLPEQQKANQNRWWTFNRLWGEDAVEVYHALVGIVPNSLYDKHPEYFPLVNGKRLRGDTNPDSSEVQRCLSNPDVQKMAAESTAQYFNKNPGCRFASLSANDAGGPQGGFCECDSCKALGPTPSHQILAFGNAVAKANEARYPDRGYAFLAYRHTLNPPLDELRHVTATDRAEQAPESKFKPPPAAGVCPGLEPKIIDGEHPADRK